MMPPPLLDLDFNVDSNLLISQLDTFWQTCPYTAAALVCGIKASAADWVAQSQQQQQSRAEEEEDQSSMAALVASNTEDTLTLNDNRDQNWDVKRNLAFLLYGALYQGMAHEFIFNHLYPVWFGTGIEMEVVATKVAFNLLVQTTLVTLPVAYLCKAVIMNDDRADGTSTRRSDDESHSYPPAAVHIVPNNNNRNHNPIEVALEKYWNDIQTQGLLWKCFALWGPVQCLTFSVVPEHLRVTFMAGVSFFWLIMLSHISSSKGVAAVDDANSELEAPIPLTR